MVKLLLPIEKELEAYRITFAENVVTEFTAADFNNEAFFTHIESKVGKAAPRVLSSMWLRRYSFFITAQLYLLSKHRIAWTGTLKDVGICEDPADEHWYPTFAIKNDNWLLVKEDEASTQLRRILSDYGAAVIHQLADKTKIPKLTLWENIWGYANWMYSQLIQQNEDHKNVISDIEMLLEDDVWNGIEKRSPFKRFTGTKSIVEAAQEYKRVTCCLYYEIRGHNKCPYCPFVKLHK